MDLRDFDLIDPCGMPGLVSTSIAEERAARRPPSTAGVERAGTHFAAAFAAEIRAPLTWAAGPAGEATETTLVPARAPACSSSARTITGWWVATIVDRDFDRSRFARAAAPVDDHGDCQNCRTPAGDGVRVRVLKDYAFHVIGTEAERDEARPRDHPGERLGRARGRRLADHRGAPEEHRSLAQVGELVERMLTLARDAVAEATDLAQTDYVQVVQNWGAQAGARTNPCAWTCTTSR